MMHFGFYIICYMAISLQRTHAAAQVLALTLKRDEDFAMMRWGH